MLTCPTKRPWRHTLNFFGGRPSLSCYRHFQNSHFMKRCLTGLFMRTLTTRNWPWKGDAFFLSSHPLVVLLLFLFYIHFSKGLWYRINFPFVVSYVSNHDLCCRDSLQNSSTSQFLNLKMSAWLMNDWGIKPLYPGACLEMTNYYYLVRMATCLPILTLSLMSFSVLEMLFSCDQFFF